MVVEFARKSLGWMVVWSTVLRREHSATAAGWAAVLLGGGRVGGIGRGDRHGRQGRCPYNRRAGTLPGRGTGQPTVPDRQDRAPPTSAVAMPVPPFAGCTATCSPTGVRIHSYPDAGRC